MVFQQFNLFAHMTVLQNVMLGPVDVLGVSKEEARGRAMDLLSRVGVAEQADKVPHSSRAASSSAWPRRHSPCSPRPCSLTSPQAPLIPR